MSNRAAFQNRVRIVGGLTLTSDLYLGDGDTRDEHRLKNEKTRVATVAKAHDGRPTIPGAALRGVVRHYLEECNALRSDVESLFGKAAPERNRSAGADAQQGEGGRLDFAYAQATDDRGKPAVVASVGIDRVTRTASDRILFASECVPRGTSFRVELVGYDLDKAQLGLLLTGLDGFNDDAFPLRLGANHADHCGRAQWSLESVAEIDASALYRWLSETRPDQWNALADRCLVTAQAPAAMEAASLRRPHRLVLAVALHFEGPFLINDPTRVKPKTSESDERFADRVPRLTPDGRALLPASSFRGAFRSQAERIVRTLAPGRVAGLHEPRSPGAVPGDMLEPIFGFSGQRSTIEFTDFVSEKSYLEYRPGAANRTAQHIQRQEFVAIDRFTGGAADKLKFNAEYVWRPVLHGKIAFDRSKVEPWAEWMLILTLRDLIEGDITFGFGAAKGYGACTAVVGSPGQINWPTDPATSRKEFQKALLGDNQHAGIL